MQKSLLIVLQADPTLALCGTALEGLGQYGGIITTEDSKKLKSTIRY